MELSLTKTQRRRRSARLALFNSYHAVYERADASIREAGKRWYYDANDAIHLISRRLGYSPGTVGATIATLSPGTRWPDNIRSAISALKSDWDAAFNYTRWGSRPVNKARRIVREEPSRFEALELISGEKTEQFYRSFFHERGAVTIDKWIYEINKLGYLSETPGTVYWDEGTAAMKMLSSYMGTETFETQAILWVQRRKEENMNPYQRAHVIAEEILREMV